MKICQGKSHRLWCTCSNNTVCPGLSFACFVKEQVSQIMMHLQQQQQSSYTLHWSKGCADPPPMLETDPLWIATHWVINPKGGLTCLISETLGIEEGLAGDNPEMIEAYLRRELQKSVDSKPILKKVIRHLGQFLRSLKDRVFSSFPGFMSSWKGRNPPWSSRERKVTYKAIGVRLLLHDEMQSYKRGGGAPQSAWTIFGSTGGGLIPHTSLQEMATTNPHSHLLLIRFLIPSIVKTKSKAG